MQFEESATVVEVRGRMALVRLKRSASCSGCASAGQCHAGRVESEKLLEVRNELGAVAGDAVRVAVSARAAFNASANRYFLPLAGLLIGAGVSQLLAAAFISAEAGAAAPGFGGIAGAIVGVYFGRRQASKPLAAAVSSPRITRVVANIDSRADHG